MRYRKLGRTGLFVSELSLGTMTFGGEGRFSAIGAVQQAEAEALVARALAAGVNLIDTADAYSEGSSEQILGRALRSLKVRREDVLVATKAFMSMGSGPNARGASRGHIMDAVKASLTRLQLDYVDLYQLHAFDPATPIEETVRALNDLVRQGLVRYVGVSNWSAWQMMKALGISERLGLARFDSLQAYYSVAGRDLERELAPFLLSEGVGLLVWSPLAGGLLSGKVGREQKAEAEAESRRAKIDFPPVDRERAFDVIDVMRPIAEARGVSVARVALSWVLHQKHVTSVIVGAKTLQQLDDNLAAAELVLNERELAAIDEASRLPAEYPGWMLSMMAAERLQQMDAARR
ncbi:aldo/keto reductase [Pyxidicoccus sp. 3LG]